MSVNRVNDSRIAVGQMNIYPSIYGRRGSQHGEGRAFIYQGGTVQHLNDLLPPNSALRFNSAVAINNNSRIVRIGSVNGQWRAVLLELNQ